MVLSGGEPLLQVGDELVSALHDLGFEIALETNGTLAAPRLVDWITVSPKGAATLAQTAGNELKLVFPQANLDPASFEGLAFNHFFLQPLDGPDHEFEYGSRSSILHATSTLAPLFADTQTRRNPMKITQAFSFEAAHRLPNVPKTHRCHCMHGHSYRVEICLTGAVDPHTGFVIDFFDVEAAFNPLLNRLDHHCLNEVEGLENPTAENIAVWIWDRVQTLAPTDNSCPRL